MRRVNRNHKNKLFEQIYGEETSLPSWIKESTYERRQINEDLESTATSVVGAIPIIGDLAALGKAISYDAYKFYKAIDALNLFFEKHSMGITGYDYTFKSGAVDENFIVMINELEEHEKNELRELIDAHLKRLKTMIVSIISASPDEVISGPTALLISNVSIEQFVINVVNNVGVLSLFFDLLGKAFQKVQDVPIFGYAFKGAPISTIFNAKKAKEALGDAKSFSELARDGSKIYYDINQSGYGDEMIDITPGNISERKIIAFKKYLVEADKQARKRYKKTLISMNLLESSSHEKDIIKEIEDVQDRLVLDLIDLLQRMIESTSIPGSSGLSILAGALSQATFAKEFILGAAHTYFKNAGEKAIRRRIAQFTPAAITAMLGGPAGILISPLVALLTNLVGDAMIVLGRSVDLLGNTQPSSISKARQIKDALGDLFAGASNGMTGISFMSIAGIAKNGFEIRSGSQRLKELCDRLDSIQKSGSGTSRRKGFNHPVTDRSDSTVDPRGYIGDDMELNTIELPPGLPEK